MARARAQFDLDADPGLLAAHLDADPLLAGRPAGLRVPGAWDPFELAVRAILGQQITVAAATRLAGRLVRAFGEPLATGDDALGWTFPAAADLARSERRRTSPPSACRSRAARRSAASRRRSPASASFLAPVADLEAAVARLTALPGCGPWTAHYVALRGLREPDAFPAGDLHLRRAARRRRRAAHARGRARARRGLAAVPRLRGPALVDTPDRR